MRGFGALCLLRRSRRVSLAPQCAALRCPWMSARLVPVVRVPSCARGPPCVFFLLHVKQICTTVQYCRYIKNDDHEPRTTKFHLTSSGARAMHGFGAMCLLPSSRCVSLAPQCAALRCPWMSALLVLVVRVPSCVFVYCTCTANLYYSTVL